MRHPWGEHRCACSGTSRAWLLPTRTNGGSFGQMKTCQTSRDMLVRQRAIQASHLSGSTSPTVRLLIDYGAPTEYTCLVQGWLNSNARTCSFMSYRHTTCLSDC